MDGDFPKARLVEMANELAESGLVDVPRVRELIDTRDLVWAVWQDAEEPDGVGTLLVKGDRALLSIVADAKGKAMSMAGPFPATAWRWLLR